MTSNKIEKLTLDLGSWKPRLIERFSPERKRISWEGEILDYWRILAWARNGNFGLLTQCNRLHSSGNRLHTAGNRLHSAGNRLHRIKSIRYVHLTRCNRLHISGNRLHIAGNRLHIAGNRLHIAGMENKLDLPDV
ncbi:hypothetical protein Lal_00043089, partial [Lupinus albus]